MALKRACFAPVVTTTPSGSARCSPRSLSRAATAIRSSGMPAGGVYRVRPARIPSMARSEMKAGVSKSGSPALRLMMSRPSAASFFASVLTAMVAEGLSFSTFGLRCMGSPLRRRAKFNMAGGENRIKLSWRAGAPRYLSPMSDPAVTIHFDFVDPLSYLLARELAALVPTSDGRLSWSPFELHPPPTPLVTVDDPSLQGRWAEARRLAAHRGVELAPPRLVPWTRKAHELVLHAAETDLDDAVRDRIFEAYMREGRDIGRVDVLVALASDAGLDRTRTKAVLDVDRFEARVAALREAAAAEGVTDAPTVVHGAGRLEGFHNRDRLGTLLGT